MKRMAEHRQTQAKLHLRTLGPTLKWQIYIRDLCGSWTKVITNILSHSWHENKYTPEAVPLPPLPNTGDLGGAGT